jgi:tRNA (cytidine/uridine-2'-O-)-methyltransferase
MHQEHNRRFDLPFNWPNPVLQVVLVEPEIPPNTGNIARLCAATGSQFNLVGQLGFRLHDRALRRAGVDYWDEVNIRRYLNFDEWFNSNSQPNFYLFTTAAQQSLFDISFIPGDSLIFGSESKGLSDELLEKYPLKLVQIPMMSDKVRSLNLANSVSIATYEALRQIHYK